MAVKIRLTRKGKKKQPSYRVVVADSRSPRDGRYIEQIGRYDPRQEPSLVEIDTERAAYWMENGAQPSDAVRRLLEISGLLEPTRVRRPKVHVVGAKPQHKDADRDATEEPAPVEDAVETETATAPDASLETAEPIAEAAAEEEASDEADEEEKP